MKKSSLMKKMLATGLAAAMIMGMTGCGSSASTETDEAADSKAASAEAASAAAATDDAELTEIDVVLDWYPNAIHTFLYQAIDEGYFEEEGLKVNPINPAESVDAITFVASGRAQVGLTYPSDIIQANDNGMNVKAIGTVSQKALDCMCSLKSNEDVTEDMSSLKGKKIGHSGNAIEEAVIKTVTANAGLTEDDYEMVDVGFDLITSLTTESVDMTVGSFINDEVPTMQNAGYDVNVYTEQDYGVPEMYGLVMAVNGDDYEQNTEIYEGFMRACQKGFDDIMDEEDLAIEVIMKDMNSDDNPLEEDQQRQSFEILRPRLEPEGSTFMAMDDETWQEVIDWMAEYDLIEGEVSVDDVRIAQ